MKLKKVLPLITFAALFGASTAASATCGTTACAGKIDTVYYTSNGTIYIGTNGDETSLNCTAVADVYVTLPSTNANQKAIYATVLTAKASDQNVVLRIKEGTSNCELDWIRLDPATS